MTVTALVSSISRRVLIAGAGLYLVGAAMGAPGGSPKHKIITDADRAFWSFQPVKEAPVPAVHDAAWCRNPIDQFILARLEAEGLTPAPEADRRTLIRRATFDLHGLPPTPAEVDAFVNDRSTDAYEKLIDRLQASPRYGERWGRHWLDLVRYAESDGFKQDAYRPNAWPYRDYVIRSFNDDKPYDRFVTEQLAGDEIAPRDPDAMVATGYMRHGLYEYNQRDVPKQWSQMLTDVTDVTGDVFLGLSMGCARCHDHKFDPILQTDYFRLQAFFAPMLPRNDLPLATEQQKADYAKAMAEWEQKTESIRAQMLPMEQAGAAGAAKAAIKKFPEDMQAILNKPASERTPLEEQLALLASRQVYDESENPQPKIAAKDKERYAELKKELAGYDTLKPKPLPRGMFTTDVGPIAPPAFIPGHLDQPLGPGIPVVLEKLPGSELSISPSATSTGYRTALAKWITQPANPLTSRVMVNRIWQYHFGRGLVITSSDYGHLGAAPTHPELLDWLAQRFVQDSWSFKKIHRLIMTSAVYRQTALRETPKVARLKDPEDRWLWRMNTSRLDAEQIRDTMLAVSGELQSAEGGPAVETTSPIRAVYTKVVRNTRDPVLDAFDAPDSFASVCTRNTTTTPTQSLLMINGDWPLKRAAAFAARVRAETKASDPGSLIDSAYRLAYGRAPEPAERKTAIAFLDRQSSKGDSAARADAGPTGSDLPVTQTMPQRDGQAILIRNANPSDMLCLPENAALPEGDFSVEAYVQLESYCDDASVRVIASCWDGSHDHAGWALGVTGEKSKFQPHNLILQLVGKGGYEVVPSELHLSLHKAYYVAASVTSDGSGENVMFYTKDITDMDAPLKSHAAQHKVAGPFTSNSPLVIGGRAGTAGHPAQGWDGLIDEVRLCKAAIKPEQLLFNNGDAKGLVAGYWQFEEHPGLLRDTAGVQKDLAPLVSRQSKSPKAAASGGPSDAALTDFCHVLFNSNEFLYVD
jgi:hypothetical protein